MKEAKFKCPGCGFTYGKHWQRSSGLCDCCDERERDLRRGIDPDNERTCRNCAGSGCAWCDGCGERKRG